MQIQSYCDEEKLIRLSFVRQSKFSNYSLEEFDEDEYVQFVCHNTMSKNWNCHQANVFVKVYSVFGYDGITEMCEENLLMFRISKKKKSE